MPSSSKNCKPSPGAVRLHKVLADAGVASRRKCEELILEGRVKVNGRVVSTLPAFCDPLQDRVEVDGQVVRQPRTRRAAASRLLYIALHKPKRIISTTHDDLGRTGVIDLVPPELSRGQRLYPVGRLDAESTGLILLTNDGELANRLTHPRFGVTKQYRVAVRGSLTDEEVDRLKRGLHLTQRQGDTAVGTKRAAMEDVRRIAVQHDRDRGDRTILLVTLREGQNREIRRLIEKLGHKVKRLERTAIGPLHLKGLPSGAARPLTPPEVRALQNATKTSPWRAG